MQPRISASLIICREQISGPFEILMIHRKSGLSFSEALIFPGGSLEPSDSSPEWHSLLGCSTDSVPATNFSDPIDLTSLRITAIRETWEEIGVLLANKPMQDTSKKDFLEKCKELQVRPSIEKLHYFSRCIAPIRTPKRFDTSFFISIEGGQEIIVDHKETDAFAWGTPSFFLEEFRMKRIKLWPPQVFILKQLSNFSSLTDLFANTGARHMYPMLFQGEIHRGNEIIWYLPGDYRHDLTPATLRHNKSLHYLISSDIQVEYYQSADVTEFLHSLIVK